MSENQEFGDKYRLIWRSTGIENAGEVRNYSLNNTSYRRTPITLDDKLIKQIKMRFIASRWGDNGPAIVVSEAFMNLPRPLRDAGVWHEMGHIHHEHLLQDDYISQEKIRESRITAVMNGKVISFETEADQFAVKYVKINVLADFLRYMLLTRPTGGDSGWNQIGKLELEMRIKAVLTI